MRTAFRTTTAGCFTIRKRIALSSQEYDFIEFFDFARLGTQLEMPAIAAAPCGQNRNLR
jgi:hypothetical protein